MMLNELDDTLRDSLPPTDCRLRPDIRQMEEGDIGTLAALNYLQVLIHGLNLYRTILLYEQEVLNFSDIIVIGVIVLV